MDEDLAGMSREQLMEEVRKLRRGIRTHRDSTGHELCWHHPALWGLLPEKQDPLPTVPEWPEFLRGCLRYRESLDRQAPDAPRSHRPYDGEDRCPAAAMEPEFFRLAERVRAAMVDVAVAAYEDASMQGLCHEGAWEAAISAMRRIDLDQVLDQAQRNAAPNPSSNG